MVFCERFKERNERYIGSIALLDINVEAWPMVPLVTSTIVCFVVDDANWEWHLIEASLVLRKSHYDS